MPFMLAYRYSGSDPWRNLPDFVFDTGAEASTEAKSRNAQSKQWEEAIRYKVVPLPIEDPLAWRIRENAKFKDGSYALTPWDEKYGHTRYFEHIDPDDPTKVRFFPSDLDGQRGKATVMAPGRFYMRFIDAYPEPGVVEGYCAQMGLDMTVSKLQIEMSEDGIERVYTTGPHSCMAYPHSADKFDSPYHPVRNYGAGDLGVAYITRGGDITARCMVWPEKKWFGRIYGDEERLRLRLDEEGYTQKWEFVGARLKLDRSGGQIIAPYVDGAIDGTLTDTHIVLVPSDEATVILKAPEGFASADSCYICGASGVPIHWNEDEDVYSCNNH